MAEQLQAMLASRKQLTDAIAHELRTPLVRLEIPARHAGAGPSAEEQQGWERDLGALDARDRGDAHLRQAGSPELPRPVQRTGAGPLGRQPPRRLAGAAPETRLELESPVDPLPWRGDTRLLDRALENLIGNALRHATAR